MSDYNFKKYLTKKSNDEGQEKDGLKKLTIQVPHPDKAKAAFQPLKAVANGVNFARDLVNEPANILGPVELAEKTKARSSGCALFLLKSLETGLAKSRCLAERKAAFGTNLAPLGSEGPLAKLRGRHMTGRETR